MAALTADRRTIWRPLFHRNFPVAGGVLIYQWAGVVVDPATGLARPARVAVGDITVGVAKFRVDNSLGAASAVSVEVESERAYPMTNSAGPDAITIANVGADCFWVDDQTVALTNGGGTRSRAGRIHQVTSDGVWVWIDR